MRMGHILHFTRLKMILTQSSIPIARDRYFKRRILRPALPSHFAGKRIMSQMEARTQNGGKREGKEKNRLHEESGSSKH
jgi:hypothetical protein